MKSWKNSKKAKNRKIFGLFVVSVVLFAGVSGVIHNQWEHILHALALTSVSLNSGTTTLSTYSDLSSSTVALSPDMGAYTWTVGGSNLMNLNLPFNTGATQQDFSGNSNDGTNNGNAAFTTVGCKVGGCLELDGTGDFLNHGTSAVNIGTSDFSIAAWVNIDDLSTYRPIVAKGWYCAANPAFTLHKQGVSDDFNMYFADGTNTGQLFFGTPSSYLNTWVHVVATIDRDGLVKGYINGVLDDFGTHNVTGSISNSETFYVGREFQCVGAFLGDMDGTLDEVQIYDRVLSPAEVSSLYGDGSSGNGGPTQIVDDETIVGEVWDLDITPIDNTGVVGTVVNSGNTVTISAPVVTVQLNSGTATLSTYTDLDSQVTGLSDPQAAYTWTVDAANLMALNMPFNPGSTQTDYSGNSTDGSFLGAPTFSSPSSGDCMVGGCLRFDGVDDGVNLGDGANTFETSDFTWSVWINPDTLPVAYPLIMKKSVLAEGTRHHLHIYSNDTIHYGLGGSFWNVASASFSTGTWTHLVWSHEGTVSRIYQDGVLLSTNDTGITTPSSTSDFLIGAELGQVYFDGFIDEPQVYPRRLSDAEITQIYNDGIAGTAGPTSIISPSTSIGQVWDLDVTPFDSDGSALTLEPSGNQVTITGSVVTVQLNSGTTTLSTYTDLDSQVTGLGTPQAAYTWTVDPDGGGGSPVDNLMELNIPFNLGGTQTDYSGNMNNGTIANGPVFYAGGLGVCQVGGCMEFDGTNDYISLPSGVDVSSGDFSLSAWVKTTNGGSQMFVTGFGNNSNPLSLLTMYVNSGGAVGYARDDVGGGPVETGSGVDDGIADGAWHHMAYTRRGSNYTVYVDGSVTATETSSIGTSTLDSFTIATLIRSGNPAPGLYPFDGYIDEVQYYSRAITQAHITQLYNDGIAGNASPTTIVSAETLPTEVWDLDITPFESDGSALTLVSSGNTVSITSPVITVGLNGGVTSLATYSNLTSQLSGLDTPQGAYTWTVDGGNLMELNIPFNLGGTQIDYSGNSNSGTSTNAPIFQLPGSGNCQVGGCMQFDGLNDYVVSASNSTLTGNPNFSIEAWVKIPTGATVTSNYPSIVYWGAASSGQSVFFGPRDTDVTRVYIGFYGGGQYSTNSLSLDTWHHLVWTRSGGGQANQGNTLYVDGVSVGLTNDLTPTITPAVTATPYYINGGNNRFFEGFIDEVQVHDHVLSQAQVTQSYQDGNSNLAGPTIIVSGETLGGQVWDLDITPFESDGSALTLVPSGNQVTIAAPVVTAQLNSGTTTLSTYTDLDAGVVNLGTPQAAYAWEVDSNPLASINMPFNDASPFTDFSGNGNSGVIFGGVNFQNVGSGLCKVGGCAHFIRSGDGDVQVTTPTNVSSGASPYSISLWVNIDDFSASSGVGSPDGNDYNAFIFSRGNEAGNQATHLAVSVTGSLLITHWGSDYDSGFDLSEDTWYHLFNTYDGVTDRLYVDGVEVYADEITLNVGTGSIALGRHINYPAINFNLDGVIDEFQFYNFAGSQSFVTQHYNDGNSGVAGPTSIVSAETLSTEVWDLDVTPFDSDGSALTLVNSGNQVTIAGPVVTVDLNGGVSPLSTYTDLDAQVAGLDTPQGAYTWTVDAANLMALNIPFNPGSAQLDYSGNSNDGTNTNGPVYHLPGSGDCQVGGCLEFDGVDDFIDNTGGLSSFNFVHQNAVFTIEAWISLDNPAADSVFVIIGNAATQTEKGFWFGYENRSSQSANNQLRFSLYNGGGGGTAVYSFSPIDTITDSNWHHVVAVGDGSKIYFYVDGVFAPGGVSTASLVGGDASRNVDIGVAPSASPGGYFDGKIGEVRVYPRKLTSSQVSQIYSDGIANLAGPTTITAGETRSGEVWDLDITPFESDGSALTLVPSGNQVTIAGPVVTVDLNGGVSPLSTYTDLDAQVAELDTPQGAYTWTVNASNLMALNMPFNPGGTQTDYSGNSNNGTNTNGPLYHLSGSGNCQVGGCIELDGADDYVDFGNVLNFERTDNFSFSLWIYRDTAANFFVIAKQDNFNVGEGYNIQSFADGSITFKLINTQTTNEITVSTPASAVGVGQWDHVAITYNGSSLASGVKIYANGVSQALSVITDNLTSTTQTTETFRLGCREGCTYNWFNGRIDELLVFGRELSEDEVLNLYTDGNSGNAGPTTIVSAETLSGEVWDLDVTPFESDGSALTLVPSANQVTIAGPVVTVDLNGGVSPLSTYTDLDSQVTGLDTPQGVYTWTVDASQYMVANIPMNQVGSQIDYSGSANHGTLVGSPIFHNPSSGNCRVGSCFEFDDTNRYIELPEDDADFDFTNDFTLETWIEPNSVVAATAIISKYDFTAFSQSQLSFLLGRGSTGTIVFSTYCNNANFDRVTTSAGVSPDDTFVHIVAEYFLSGEMKIYVNGVEQSTTISGSANCTSINSNNVPVLIGKEDDGGVNETYFDGVIDEVKIYGRALSSAQVLQNYTDGNANLAGPTTIVSAETLIGEVWDLDVTPFESDGSALTLVNSENQVTIAGPVVTVDLNGGVSPLSTYTDLDAQVAGLDTLQGAYTWTVDAANLMALNIPFNPGSAQLDYSGNSNDGTNTNGPVYHIPGSGDCQVGGCLEFDGVDDYVDFGDPASLNLGTNDFSISHWVKTSSSGGVIVYKAKHALVPYNGYYTYIEDGSNVRIHLGDTDSFIDPLFPMAVTNDQWHHILFTVDRDISSGIKGYLNGVFVGEADPTGEQGSLDFAIDFNLGRQTGLASYLDGLIDEVQIYDRVLSQSEITELYNDGNSNLAGPTTIVSAETLSTEVWDLDVTPFESDGSALTLVNSGNDVTISDPGVTVALNSGGAFLSPSVDLSSQVVNLGEPAAGYTWTVDSTPLMALNIPFNLGGTQTDFSGNTNNGTITNGAIFHAGGSGNCQVGACMEFDGTDDYIDLGVGTVSGTVSGASAITLTAWINANSLGGGNRARIINGITDSLTGFHLGFATGTDLEVGARSVSSDSFQRIIVAPPSLSSWHMVTGVIDYAGDSIDIYIDGAFANGGPVTFGNSTFSVGTPTFPDTIGNIDVETEGFDGFIDEVQVYPRALSSSQINQLYLDGLVNDAGPVTIKSTETVNGETWDLDVTPFESDGSALSLVASSNTVLITTNTNPNPPTLVSPADASNVTSALPALSAQYIDPDGSDTGTTEYRVSTGTAGDCLSNTNIIDFGSSGVTATNNEATIFTLTVPLTDLLSYNWCARNNDGLLTSAWTTMGSFTVAIPSGGGSAQQKKQIQQQDQENQQENLKATLSLGMSATLVGNKPIPIPVNPNSILYFTVNISNTSVNTANNVFLNIPLSSEVVFVPGSLKINNIVQSDAADQDPGQGNQNGVSVIWAQLPQGAARTITFQLAFNRDVLQEQALASAIPPIVVEASVSADNVDDLVFSNGVKLIPDLGSLVEEEVEPLPEPEPEPEVTPEPEPEPTPETHPQPEPTPEQPTQPQQPTQKPPVEEKPVGTGPQQPVVLPSELFLTGNAQSNENQIEFSGTTNEPNSTVTVTVNDTFTFTVLSDENGKWSVFVSAEEIGVADGESANVKVEAIAKKNDQTSNTVIQNVIITRTKKEVTVEPEEIVSANIITSAVKELSAQVVTSIEENQPEIQTTLVAATPVIIVASAPIWGYLPYLPTLIYHFIIWFLGLFSKKKEGEQYGVVYNSITKEPLPLAIVRVYDKVSGRLITTEVTDKQGRYEYLLPPGSYRVEIKKPQYTFPSEIVKMTQDGDYLKVYDHDRGIEVVEGLLSLPDIPVDPVDAKRHFSLANIFKKGWLTLQKAGHYLALPLLFVGALITVFMVYIVPSVFNWSLAILYIFMFVLQLLTREHKEKSWGVVYDLGTDAALPLTSLQLIDPEFGKVVKSRLSDYQGRFAFLPEPGKYVIKASKAGFTQAEVVEGGKIHNPISGEVEIQKEGERLKGDVAMTTQETDPHKNL